MDRRPPCPYVINILISVHIPNLASCRFLGEKRLSSYSPESANGGVYSTWDKLKGFFKKYFRESMLHEFKSSLEDGVQINPGAFAIACICFC